MGYDSDDDLVDEEELSAFVARHGFVEASSDEDDDDDKLLQAVQEQVGTIFRDRGQEREAEEEEEYDGNEADEAVLQSLKSVCERVQRSISSKSLGPSSGADSQVAGAGPQQLVSQPNAADSSAAASFLEKIRAGNSFLFGNGSTLEADGEDGAIELQETEGLDNNPQLLQHALDKNRQCQEMLRSLLGRVEEKKKQNAELQRRVKTLKSFEKYCKRRVYSFQGRDARFIASLASLSHTKRRRGKQIVTGPEKNKDVDGFKALCSHGRFSTKEWSAKESEALKDAVKLQVQQHLLVQAMEAVIMDVETEQSLASREEEINNISDAEVRNLVEVVDWNKVAQSSLPGRSAKECKARWVNHEDKLINHGPWNKNEDMELLRLAQEFGYSNWEAIAEKLGTYRTGAQCLIRYQRSLNANLWRKDWTAEDDEQLKAAVELCGDKDWQSVAACLEGRTGPQVMHRWQNVIQLRERKRGRWSIEEDKRLKWAVLIFGAQQWKKISMHVPGRTGVQCRERWRNVLDPALKHDSWTSEEDEKLEKTVEMYGQHRWASVAEVMKPRTDNQCWRRWMALHPESKDKFHKEVEMKRTLLPRFGKRKKECPDLEVSDIVSIQGEPEELDAAGSEKKRGRGKRKRPTCEDDVEQQSEDIVVAKKPKTRARKASSKESPTSAATGPKTRQRKKSQGSKLKKDGAQEQISTEQPDDVQKCAVEAQAASDAAEAVVQKQDKPKGSAKVAKRTPRQPKRNNAEVPNVEVAASGGVEQVSAEAAGGSKQRRAARVQKLKSRQKPKVLYWPAFFHIATRDQGRPRRQYQAIRRAGGTHVSGGFPAEAVRAGKARNLSGQSPLAKAISVWRARICENRNVEL